MRIKALLLLIVILLPTSPVFAISGGPWGSNTSTASAIGTYSASMRGENTIGFMAFSYNPNSVPSGYASVFSQGLISFSSAQGYVDAQNLEITGVFGTSGFRVVTSEDGEGKRSTFLFQLRSDVLGAWEGKLLYSGNSAASAQTFEGTGEASTRAFFIDIDGRPITSIVEISITGVKSSQSPTNFGVTDVVE